MRKLLLPLVLVLAACQVPTAPSPLPEGAIEITMQSDPVAYSLIVRWYDSTLVCQHMDSSANPLTALSIYIAPSSEANGFLGFTDPQEGVHAAGAYSPTRNAIVLGDWGITLFKQDSTALGNWVYGKLIEHEVTHALLHGAQNHPPEYFNNPQRCGDLQ